jgi:hypothetical protein
MKNKTYTIKIISIIVVIMTSIFIQDLLAESTDIEVYSNDFEGVVGPEWSNTSTDVTPKGARRFLGRFGNDAI